MKSDKILIISPFIAAGVIFLAGVIMHLTDMASVGYVYRGRSLKLEGIQAINSEGVFIVGGIILLIACINYLCNLDNIKKRKKQKQVYHQADNQRKQWRQDQLKKWRKQRT